MKITLDISNLTSEFLEIIPTKDMTYWGGIRPIDTLDELNKKKYMLSKLLDVEQAIKILLAAKANVPAIHPLDYVIRALNIKI